ncbi:HET-domain-containing protein [Nemania diffusa]|nr:HET-domain-containing protein [Nemania diffusa]
MLGPRGASRRHASSEAGDEDRLRLYQRQLHDRDYEVRLLELQESSSPGGPESGQAFTCRLQYFSLKDFAQYVALSYCCGDLPNTRDLVIENAKILVSETLLSALEQLWRMGHTRIWVDYLCINQDDNDEKSSQVRMVDIIFSKAATVFAWLGTGDHDSDMAMAVLGASRPTEQFEPPEEIEIACDAVVRLLSRPYWTRCWVIQEICVARSPIIVCGARSVALSTILNRLDTLGTSAPAQYAQYLISPLRQMRYREQNKASALANINLIPLLVLSRRSLASDPRDKLYALLPLAKDGRTLIPTPNYSQTVEQVFFDTARCIIEGHDRTDIILLAHRARGVRDLLSWAPDWANMHSQPPPWVLEILHERFPPRVVHNKIHGKALQVQGIRYDTIVDLLDYTAYETERAINGPDPGYPDSESVISNLYMGLTIGAEDQFHQVTVVRVLLGMCHEGNGSIASQRPSRLRNWFRHNANRFIGGATLKRHLEICMETLSRGVSTMGTSANIDTREQTQSAIEQGFERLERLRMVFAPTYRRGLRIVYRDAKRGDKIYFFAELPSSCHLTPENKWENDLRW